MPASEYRELVAGAAAALRTRRAGRAPLRRWMVRGRTVVIGRGTVAVTDRSWFGGHSWREPLANYREICAYREFRTHRAGVRSWYVVRLWHPEPAKAIELACAKDPVLIERQALDWARRLGLPLSWQQIRTDRDGYPPCRTRQRDCGGHHGGPGAAQGSVGAARGGDQMEPLL
jgi:hypothetical protein